MDKNDFYLNILIGIISGLIVLLGSFVAEPIDNVWLKIGVTVTLCFILFIVFVKIMEKNRKHKK
jgi:uncharacterized membrane protein YfcA